MNSGDTEREGKEFLASWRAEMEAKVAAAKKREWKSPAAKSHVGSARMTLETIHLELSEWDALEAVQGYLAQAELAEVPAKAMIGVRASAVQRQHTRSPRDGWLRDQWSSVVKGNFDKSVAKRQKRVLVRLWQVIIAQHVFRQLPPPADLLDRLAKFSLEIGPEAVPPLTRTAATATLRKYSMGKLWGPLKDPWLAIVSPRRLQDILANNLPTGT